MYSLPLSTLFLLSPFPLPSPSHTHMLHTLLCRFFTSVRTVLQGACHMVAMQIACEPLVRQTLRQVFQSRAVICTKPTKKGRKVVALKHSSSHLTLLSTSFSLFLLLPSSFLSPSLLFFTSLFPPLMLLSSPILSLFYPPLLLPSQLIDDTHPCYSMKYVRNKPVRDLKEDEYLRLAQAEEDHLLELKISIDLEQGSDKRWALFSQFVSLVVGLIM